MRAGGCGGCGGCWVVEMMELSLPLITRTSIFFQRFGGCGVGGSLERLGRGRGGTKVDVEFEAVVEVRDVQDVWSVCDVLGLCPGLQPGTSDAARCWGNPTKGPPPARKRKKAIS